jgi:hypothetical protein
MGMFEEPAQQFIAEPQRLVQAAAGTLVVPEINESAGLAIDRVGPIRVVQRRNESDEVKRVEAPAVPESALIGHLQDMGYRVITMIAPATTLINGVDDQVRA